MQSGKKDVAIDTTSYDAYLEQARIAIDNELSNIMPRILDLKLGERIKYVLLTRGKRLRSILVMLSAQSLDGTVKTVKQLALAIELLHSATLIHDDILDQDTFRRNTLTANAKWGVRDAILVGDALASISLHLAADYDAKIVKILSQTCLWLSDGEYLDVEKAAELKSESDYLEMIQKKSACLFKAATECGALAAKGSVDEVRSLGAFGGSFGLAYQIKDDLFDMFHSESTLPQDINEFRLTLPIIHLCNSASPSARDRILKAIVSIKTQNPQQKTTSVKTLCQEMENSGSLNYCIDKIDEYAEDAIKNIEPLRDSVYKTFLVRMANGLKIDQQSASGDLKSCPREKFIFART